MADDPRAQYASKRCLAVPVRVVRLWCKAYCHRGPADLQAIIDAGLGDKPLKDLRLRCAKCGSRMTDAVMMGRGGVGVQPWRSEAG
jgi:hypothetical protein